MLKYIIVQGGFAYGVQLQQTMEITYYKGLTKTDMCLKAGISTNILAKMGKGKPVSMESLAKMATALQCGLDNIVEITADAEKGGIL